MNRKDILGNEIKSECVGCAIVRGEVKLPGGIIYDGESIILAADPEIPIPGFLIITSKRHIQSYLDMVCSICVISMLLPKIMLLMQILRT